MKYILLVVSFYISLMSDPFVDDFPNTCEGAPLIPFNTNITSVTDTDDDYSEYFKIVLEKDEGIKKIDINNSYSLSILDENCTWLYKYLNKAYNFKSGTYYLQMKNSTSADYSDFIVGKERTFKLVLNNNVNDNNITLDYNTIQYCVSNPSLCGINIDSLVYTDIDKDNFILETKRECFDDPSICNLPVKLKKNDIKSLPSGWSLIGTSYEISDLSIFDEVKIVWYWDNGWKAYSSVYDLSMHINVNSLGKIDTNKGFWVFKE